MMCECGCGREVKPGNRFVRGHYWNGKTLSSETRRKLSDVNKGKKHTEETKKKMSEAHKGKIGSFKGGKHTEESKKKIGEASRGRVGQKHTEETKRKLSEANKGKKLLDKTKRKISLSSRGEKGNNWQGGISFGKYCPKFNGKVKEETRERYGRKCVICNKTEDANGRKLDVHHIDYNKQQGCEEHKWKLVPLCRSCHSKTSNGDREYWENLIMENLEALN